MQVLDSPRLTECLLSRLADDSGPAFGYGQVEEGPMTTITPEIRQPFAQAGERPVP
jgi:hypothetical protein